MTLSKTSSTTTTTATKEPQIRLENPTAPTASGISLAPAKSPDPQLDSSDSPDTSDPRSTAGSPHTSSPAPARQAETFSDALHSRHNAFNFLRLVFASLVLVSHHFVIGNFGYDPLLDLSGRQTDFGRLGLLGFFVISGFLITRSAQRTPIIPFVWRRVLRIFPAFVVVLVLTASVIGPAVYWYTHRTLDSYWTFAESGPWSYVSNNIGLRIGQYGIHDVFQGIMYGEYSQISVMNGSLWTLWYEFVCYMMVAGLAIIGALKSRRWMVVTLLAGVLFVLSPLSQLDVVPARIQALGVDDGFVLHLTAVFVMGATAALWSYRIRIHIALALVAATVVAVTIFTGLFSTLGLIGWAYLTLYLAARIPAPLRNVGATNDISYGVYVYGWPVQGVLSLIGVTTWGYVPYLATTFLVLVPLGWLSWTLIEKPAMRAKNWGPGSWQGSWRGITKQSQANPS